MHPHHVADAARGVQGTADVLEQLASRILAGSRLDGDIDHRERARGAQLRRGPPDAPDLGGQRDVVLGRQRARLVVEEGAGDAQLGGRGVLRIDAPGGWERVAHGGDRAQSSGPRPRRAAAGARLVPQPDDRVDGLGLRVAGGPVARPVSGLKRADACGAADAQAGHAVVVDLGHHGAVGGRAADEIEGRAPAPGAIVIAEPEHRQRGPRILAQRVGRRTPRPGAAREEGAAQPGSPVVLHLLDQDRVERAARVGQVGEGLEAAPARGEQAAGMGEQLRQGLGVARGPRPRDALILVAGIAEPQPLELLLAELVAQAGEALVRQRPATQGVMAPVLDLAAPRRVQRAQPASLMARDGMGIREGAREAQVRPAQARRRELDVFGRVDAVRDQDDVAARPAAGAPARRDGQIEAERVLRRPADLEQGPAIELVDGRMDVGEPDGLPVPRVGELVPGVDRVARLLEDDHVTHPELQGPSRRLVVVSRGLPVDEHRARRARDEVAVALAPGPQLDGVVRRRRG